MSSRGNTPESPAGSSAGDVERLLATVEEQRQGGAPGSGGESPTMIHPHDFRNPSLLSARDLQKLRLHQTEFVNSLASRLSLLMRMEIPLKLAGIQTVLYQRLAQGWSNPTCLTLFKAEPMRGVGILEVSARLGFGMVDRLMGGPGNPADSTQELSEIETAILEQAAQLIIEEWCGHWHGAKEFRPVVLGYESNGKYVQVASPETAMLAIALETRLGGSVEKLQIAFPYAALEAFIRQLSQGANSAMEPSPIPISKPAPKWNASFDDVRVPVAARWHWMEMAARDLLSLKIGDVLRAEAQAGTGLQVCVAGLPRFDAHPGIVGGKWAAELARAIKD